VESVNIITDRYTGQSKGFGFIELSTKQEAAEAIGKMNSTEMDGRTLKVSEALPQAPRDRGGSRGYGGPKDVFRGPWLLHGPRTILPP
jgi:RNA recognition motif-containing protein